MKKVKICLSVFILLIFGLLMSACTSSDKDLKSLQNALDNCQDLLSEYELRIEELESKVESLQRNTKLAINRYDTNIADLEREISLLDESIENLQKLNGVGIEVYLASQYYLVIGDTFQLFYRSVIKAVNPYGYYIRLSGDDGHAYNRYYEFSPTKTGTYKLKIEVCDSNGNVFGSDSTNLIVSANKSTNKSKTVLCIGDSLTSSGQWVARGVSRYKSSSGIINTVGTVSTSSYYSQTVKHEGHGGWQWSSYISGYGSTQSPFTPNGVLSFKDYATKNGYSDISEFYIMMTFNGLPGVFTEFSFDMQFIKDAKTIIDQIHADFPNAKISLMSLPLTSTNSGLGAYYTIEKAYGDNYGKAVTVMHYGDFLEKWCEMDEYKSFMRFVDVKGQFDSEYNMPSESKKVNNNNSTTEPVGNAMGMHPSFAGYEQIGDTFYRALMSNWGN